MKDVLIIANFTGGLENLDNDRFSYLATLLSEKANVEIVTSDFIHEKKEHIRDTKRERPFRCTFLHEPGYATNISLKRFYSHIVFGENVKKYLSTRKKPDMIYCAVPSLTAAKYASDYCKNQRVPFVIDIQDLWPEAFRMVFDPPLIGDGVYAPFEMMANHIYKSADAIIGVSKTYVHRAKKVNKKSKLNKVLYLGTDLKEYDYNTKSECSIQKDSDDLWMGYCGTLGSSYDLDIVFKALHQLKNRNQECPVFVVMGDGPKETDFKEEAKRLGVDVIFTGRLPYNEMCAVLSKCDMVVNPIMPKAAQSIINKHADYAASGLPVLNTQDGKEYRQLVSKYQMGFNCSNQSPEQLADRIAVLCNNADLRKQMGKNARRCAQERFDRRTTYRKLSKKLLDYLS